MNPLHLLWICPACCALGVISLALVIGGRDGK